MTDLVRGVNEENRRMREEHIAYILKEIIKVGISRMLTTI